MANIERAKVVAAEHRRQMLTDARSRMKQGQLSARRTGALSTPFNASTYRPWLSALQTNAPLADGRPLFDPMGQNYALDVFSRRAIERAHRLMSPTLSAHEDRSFILLGKHLEADPGVCEALPAAQEVAEVLFVDCLRTRGWVLFASTTDDQDAAAHELLALLNQPDPAEIRRRLYRGIT